MGTFDTALMEALLSVGISPERARAVVESFDRSIDERYSLHAQVLATKRDLAEVETRLWREMAEMKAEIAGAKVEIAGVKVEIAGVRAEIAGVKSDLTRWFLGALTAQTALVLGAVKLF